MLPWTLLFPASSLCGASSPRPGSGSVLRRGDEDVRQLQCEDALGVEQVSRNVEGVRGGGFQTRKGRDARNLGEVRDGKNRHGLDPGLGGVDGHLLTLLDRGEQLLTDLLGNVVQVGLVRGLGVRCYHCELLESLWKVHGDAGPFATYLPDAWYVKHRSGIFVGVLWRSEATCRVRR